MKLQRALEIVKPGLANRDIVEQATSFAFVSGRVVTYNDEISISHPIEGLDISGAVRADKLYELLTKIKPKKDKFQSADYKDPEDFMIDISVTENEVTIESGRITAGLTLEKEIRLPLEEEIVIQSDWFDLPEKFIKSVDFAVGSCSKDMSRPILTCVHVNQKGFIEGSDGYRITRCELQEDMPIGTFLLPASSAVEMVKFNPVAIAEGKGWMHFHSEDDAVLSCRLFDSDVYPATADVLKMKGTKITLPNTIEAVLDRAIVFAKQDHILNEIVEITLEDKRFQISAKVMSGWFKEEVNINYTGKPVTFYITPYLLKGILAETQGCELSESKLKFEGENWVYVTMLRNK